MCEAVENVQNPVFGIEQNVRKYTMGQNPDSESRIKKQVQVLVPCMSSSGIDTGLAMPPHALHTFPDHMLWNVCPLMHQTLT